MLMRCVLFVSCLGTLSACSQGGGGTSPAAPDSPNDAQEAPAPSEVTKNLPMDVYIAGTLNIASKSVAGYWKNGE